MPVIDGYASTQQIRQWEAAHQRKPLPIIALTADAFEEVRLQCLAVGMDDVLTKPVEFDVLASRLARWLTATAVPGRVPDTAARTKPVDHQQLALLVSQISPMLARHSFDAMRRFRALKDLLADTDLAAQVCQMETELKALRFDLVLAQLQQLNPLSGQPARKEAP
jgi:DNA-binding response OmpR family regulator